MPIDKDGNRIIRDASDIRRIAVEAMLAQHDEFDPTKANPAMDLFDAMVQIPLSGLEDDFSEHLRQSYAQFARGQNLDLALEPIGTRKAATRSTGTINATLSTVPGSPDPYFQIGDLIFEDEAGNLYDMTADVALPTTTDMSIQLRARSPGAFGNLEAGAMLDGTVRFANATVQARWDGNVTTHTNNAEFTGGGDTESDARFANRVIGEKSAIPSSSINGILSKLINDTAGVTNATLVNNPSKTPLARELLYDGSANTGTASESIDTVTNTKIAQKVTLTASLLRYVAYFNATLSTIATNPTFTVRLETDTAGSPSGTLVDTKLSVAGFAITGTAETSGGWDPGYRLDTAEDVWLVFECTAGDATFDGENASTDDNVKYWDGAAWQLSAVDNLNVDLIAAIPPNSYRAFVSGSASGTDIASALSSEAAGIVSDGLQTGTWTAINGQVFTERWDQPTQVPVVIKIDITKTSAFTGDEDDIKNVITEYVGGTDTDGVIHDGTGVNVDLIINRIIGAIMDTDNLAGMHDVTLLRQGRKADFATPAALTATEDVNLSAAEDEEFIISDVATDIEVTLSDL